MRNLRRALSLALASVMVLGLMIVGSSAKTADFGDADQIDEQYAEAIDVLTTVGIIDGMNDDGNNFNPVGTLTRAQAAKLLSVMLLGEDNANKLGTNDQIFQDVPKGNWAAGYIAYCNSVGILAGNGDGTFNPEGKLTGVQFGKMLLVALGYRADIEAYVNSGSSWEVNVATDMLEAGIDVDDISFSDPISREQAAQMVFNTLCAPMVEYTSNNNVTNRVYKTTTLAKTQTISDQKLSNTNYYTIEFGEKFFTKLVKTTHTQDEFGRPSYTWNYNNADIDTYVDYSTKVASYTTHVEGGTVYNDIGSVAAKYTNINYWINGVQQGEAQIKADISDILKKNNESKFAKSGNSVLTEVYVNDDDETIDVIVIDTYLAKVDGDYNTKSDALPIVLQGDLRLNGNSALINKVYKDDVNNIEEFENDDYILVQIANGIVVNVIKAEILSNVKITRFSVADSAPSSVTSNDIKYNSSELLKMFPKSGNPGDLSQYSQSVLKDTNYNLYIDQYGNLAGVKAVDGNDKFLFLVGYELNSSALANTTADANIILSDGSMLTVKLDVTKSNDDDHLGKQANTIPTSVDGVSAHNVWYKYEVADDVYTLKEVAPKIVVKSAEAPEKINVENVRVVKKSIDADASKTNEDRGYGNDDTIYVTVESKYNATDRGAAITKASTPYTGAQNVDITVENDNLDADKDTGDTTYTPHKDIYSSIWALIDKDTKYIKTAIIRGSETGSSIKSIAYGLKGAKYEEYNKNDDCYYWSFQAVVDGKVQDLIVKDKYGDTINKIQSALPTYLQVGTESDSGRQGAALLKLTYDKDGYVTAADVLKDDSTNPKVYGKVEYDAATPLTDDYDAYLYQYINGNTDKVRATGNTIQSASENDVGLTVDKNAPVVVIQNDASGNLVINEYTSIKSAIDAVTVDNNSKCFEGIIAAGLNERGTAAWVVIESLYSNKEIGNGRDEPQTAGYDAKLSLNADEKLELSVTSTSDTSVHFTWSLYVKNLYGSSEDTLLNSGSGSFTNNKTATIDGGSVVVNQPGQGLAYYVVVNIQGVGTITSKTFS